jgi:hypothetical protein
MNGGQAVGGYVGVPGPESLFDSHQFCTIDGNVKTVLFVKVFVLLGRFVVLGSSG